MQKMILVRFLIPFLLLLSFSAKAEPDSLKIRKKEEWRRSASNKGMLYIYWGYNREIFSKSDIHFTGPEYDVTFYQLKASDRPTPFTIKNYFNPQDFTVPQYTIHLGYFITNRFHISFGTDHMKYVVDNGQKVAISGVVSTNANAQYAGTYLQDSLTISPEVLRFEHTNGLNLMTLDFGYLVPVANLYKQKIWLKWNFAIGGLWVVTRTDVKVFGDGINNDFHVSGYSLAGNTGPRLEFWKWCFLAYEVKSGYMTLPNVLINGTQPKHASHNFGFLEYYGVFGLQAPLSRWLKKKK